MTLVAITSTLPRNSTKSPTVLIANTLSTLLRRVWKALTRATQKLVELMAKTIQHDTTTTWYKLR